MKVMTLRRALPSKGRVGPLPRQGVREQGRWVTQVTRGVNPVTEQVWEGTVRLLPITGLGGNC